MTIGTFAGLTLTQAHALIGDPAQVKQAIGKDRMSSSGNVASEESR